MNCRMVQARFSVYIVTFILAFSVVTLPLNNEAAANEEDGLGPNVIWTHTIDGHSSTPVVGSDGSIYVVTRQSPFDTNSPGTLYALSSSGERLWTSSLLRGVGSPALSSDGKILYITDGGLQAVNTIDGVVRWRFSIHNSHFSGTPTLGNDTVYVTDSRSGKLYAVDDQGKLLWEQQISSEVGELSPALIDSEGTSYIVHTRYLNDVSATDPNAYAVVVWPDNTTRYDKYESILYAYDVDGFQKWNVTLDGVKPLDAAPSMTQDKKLVIGNGVMYVIDLDGVIKWNTPNNPQPDFTTPSVNGNTIYYPHDNEFDLYNSDGRKLQSMFYGGLYGKPLVREDGSIYIWGHIGWIRAINPDGTLKWTYEITPGNLGVTPGTPIVAGTDGLLYTVVQLGTSAIEFERYIIAFRDPVGIQQEELTPIAQSTNTNTIKVLLDGQELELTEPPLLVRGRVYVPMRDLFEGLGAWVIYKDGKITAGKDDILMSYTIGKNTADVNGRIVTLDAPGRLINGRTMVPLRFISEIMGSKVDWNAVNRTVSITSTISENAT